MMFAITSTPVHYVNLVTRMDVVLSMFMLSRGIDVPEKSGEVRKRPLIQFVV